MAGRCFLTTYHPLVRTRSGRGAAERHALPPFIDGSCRSEPDFQSTFPSISSCCRAGKFARRLQEGDRVAYLTVKGKYENDVEPGWRVVAILRVIKQFSSHDGAADWYRQQNLSLPANCIVEGNPPKQFEFTSGDPGPSIKKCAEGDPDLTVQLWENAYAERTRKWPHFLATEAEVVNPWNPPQLTQALMKKIFGRLRSTQHPPCIKIEEMDQLLRLARERLAESKRD